MSRRERLRAIALDAVTEWKNHPRFRAAVLIGSVGRGEVDDVSDVDVAILLDGEPGEECFAFETKRAVESGGQVHGGDAVNGFAILRVVEGERLDVAVTPWASLVEMFDDVLLRADTDTIKQLVIDGLRCGEVLAGEDAIRPLLERSHAYPDELARAMFEANLRQRPLFVLRDMGAARNDRLFLYEEFLELSRRLLSVLYAINRQYHPGKLKGTASRIANLENAPKQLGWRLESLFALDPEDAVDEARALVLETYALVERALPAVDVAAARARFLREWTAPVSEATRSS